jgi:acyl-CoA reductase-like NAD-dependent aldehyde dehydrogenase
MPLGRRLAVLRRWRRLLARDADRWADRIVEQVGKPRGEAMAEVVTTLDQLRWIEGRAGSLGAPRRLSAGWQWMLLIPPASARAMPHGVVGMIGTWNYPLFLNVPAIAGALAMGNAVVWKPSEQAPLLGAQIAASVGEIGLPTELVGTVHGGPEVGAALLDSAIDFGQFTGGSAGGRQVLGRLGQRGIPAIAELSGFDPAIVLPDAPVESTTRALVWGAFVNAGQTCVAVKRAYIVGGARTAAEWASGLAREAVQLRMGDPAAEDVDVGPLVSAGARERFDGFIQRAVAAGAEVLAGGKAREGRGFFYEPTVLLADPENRAAEEVLAGCFGPVVLVRGVADADAAVAAANAGPYGLAASVWGRDRRQAAAIAARVEAGMVAVNDAVAPTAHAAAPFGGIKASGYGRVHGDAGLLAYTQPRVIHVRRAGGMRPQLFPYGPRFPRMLRVYRRLFHPGG